MPVQQSPVIAQFSPISTASDRTPRIELVIGDNEIDTYRYLESFSFEYGSDKSWRARVTLFDPDWDLLEAQIIGAKAAVGYIDGEVRMKFGWHDSMSPDYYMSVLSYTPTFSAEGTSLELELTHPTTTRSNAEIMSASWPAGTPPSTIVEQLAPYIHSKYASQGRRIIEPSLPHSYPIIMKEAHPISWIVEQFCKSESDKAALSAVRKGAGGYSFMLDNVGGNDILRFHTNGYNENDVSREYVFARGSMGNVLSFSVSDLSQFCQVSGSGKSKGTIVDDLQKVNYSDKIDPTGKKGRPPRYKEYVDSINAPPDTTRPARANTSVTQPFLKPDDLEKFIEARFHKLRWATYKADMEIVGDPYIQYNSFIRVSVLMPPGSKRTAEAEHYTSGIYRVRGVTHDISIGQYTTKLDLQKATEKEIQTVKQGRQLASSTKGTRPKFFSEQKKKRAK